MNLFETYRDISEHINTVRHYMLDVGNNLVLRALRHDASKLHAPELEGFAQLKTNLHDVEFGTDAYAAALIEAKPVIEHHYLHNDHHPEFFDNDVSRMSLLALIEMLADWKAASENTKNGSLVKSLLVNIKRFNIPLPIARVLTLTALELGWLETDREAEYADLLQVTQLS